MWCALQGCDSKLWDTSDGKAVHVHLDEARPEARMFHRLTFTKSWHSIEKHGLLAQFGCEFPEGNSLLLACLHYIFHHCISECTRRICYCFCIQWRGLCYFDKKNVWVRAEVFFFPKNKRESKKRKEKNEKHSRAFSSRALNSLEMPSAFWHLHRPHVQGASN